MLTLNKFENKLRGLTEAITRFPITTLFLVAATIVNIISINSNRELYDKYLFTFVVGSFLSAVLQVAYERFFTKFSTRMLLMGAGIILTIGYYFIIWKAPSYDMATGIRTFVTTFALLFAFIWIPVIKSKINFNQSFMISFKSFFNSLFFSAVIFAGINIIILAIDQLIFPVSENAYFHTANIVFVLFAPMYFLSLIPIFLGATEATNEKLVAGKYETIQRAAHCPKFLEVLISYIIIPLTAVFTLILIIYILQNIGGEFWTDNLLEPMLVSYAITVILVYILASEINNPFTKWFRKIVPKILVPIVIFQIVASILNMDETGLTHGRYYVILFGVFAAIVGILLSFLPVRKNGIIALLLIVFSAISIVPPVDAFTISRTSQINTLEKVLLKNNMLENDQIRPNKSISNKDKEIITKTVTYLDMMRYLPKTEWFPKDFVIYEDFTDTFGFEEYYPEREDMENQSVYVMLGEKAMLNISQYDTLVKYSLDIQNKSADGKIAEIEQAGKHYTLVQKTTDDKVDIKIIGENNEELINFSTQEIFDRFYNYNTMKDQISVEEATFTKENDKAKMAFVVQHLNIEKMNNPPYYNAELYILFNIK